jgi:hypothetical protein
VSFQVKEPHPLHFYRFIMLSFVSLAVSSLITKMVTHSDGDIVTAMILVALIVPCGSFFAGRLWAFAILPSQNALQEQETERVDDST